MTPLPDLALPERPKLMHNIAWFARALRKAGLSIGPGRVLDAVRAVEAAGFGERTDFYWTLQAVFVSRAADRVVFDQVFRLFWRDPRYLEQMMSYMIPAMRGVAEERIVKPAEKRAAEALLDGAASDAPELADEDGGKEIQIDAARTMSEEERLRTLDFEQMSLAEMAEAKRLIARFRLPVRPMPSRRVMLAPDGTLVDWRATLRGAARRGGEMRAPARAQRRHRWPDLIAVCDISGSMASYSRAALHFLHAAANAPHAGWGRVHAFTFGTRLTNISRHLAQRDVDAALAAAGAEAQDWEGGTRIGESLDRFNKDWSRRVMGQGAVVLIITDGLDRGDPALLGAAMRRLRLTARRVVWLNPLLRWDGFAPKAQGIAAMLDHVDSLHSGHDIATLEGMVAALATQGDVGEAARIRMLASRS